MLGEHSYQFECSMLNRSMPKQVSRTSENRGNAVFPDVIEIFFGRARPEKKILGPQS